mgnify:CR=1 FL=1
MSIVHLSVFHRNTHGDFVRDDYTFRVKPSLRCFQSWIFQPFRNFALSAVLWSMISLRPRSRAPMAAISSSLRRKSQMLKFSSIRSRWVDLGMMTTPRWAFQRRATWAAVLPLLSRLTGGLFHAIFQFSSCPLYLPWDRRNLDRSVQMGMGKRGNPIENCGL